MCCPLHMLWVAILVLEPCKDAASTKNVVRHCHSSYIRWGSFSSWAGPR